MGVGRRGYLGSIVGTVVCTHLYEICVLCKSPVLCGVVPRLYTQVK